MKTKPTIFFLLAVSALIVSTISPLPALAQDACPTYASLSVTSSKTVYQVGETFSGEVVFTNNVSQADVNFDVKAVKSGQTLISKNYTLTTQPGRNVYQLTDALGASSLPEAGIYNISITALYPFPPCSWSANLTLTAIAPAPVAPPQIQSLNPSSAPFGSTVTINGSGFGFIPFGNNIESGSVVIGRNVFSPDGKTLVFTVPDVYPGPYPLSVSNANGTSNEVMFTVTPAKPWIQSIDPSSAQPGTQVTIKGGNFTTAVGNDIKSGATVIAANVLSPDGETLTFTVPEVTPGTYPVSVFSSWYLRGTSNEVSFTVLAPPPQNLLTSLTISPQEYLLGETVTGSVSVNNPAPRPVTASFRIELYKGPPTGPSVLVWSRDIDQVSVAPGSHQFSLEDVFGFRPTIPDDPFFVDDWLLIIKNKDLLTDTVSQTFKIKAPVVQPLTLTFNFDPEEYVLGDTLQGTGAVTNPGSSPVSADFKIELFQRTTLKWQREINDIAIPSGTTNFTVDDLFGTRVVIPNEISLIGDWRLKISQLGTTPPVTAEDGFTIRSGSPAFQSVFVPDQFVPISGFIKRENPQTEPLSFGVKPEILQYLVAKNARISVARNTSAGIEYIDPTNVDENRGFVYLRTSYTGVFTAVSDAFQNDFPIVTHWDQSLNGGKGGPRIGASDALGLLDVNPQTGEFRQESYIRDSNPGNPYEYATDRYALFSGDPLNPEARVPGYERYVGEDYAVYKITDLLAIWISDQVLQKTGYPVVNKNYRGEDALPNGIRQDAPAFQVVHAYRIAVAPDKPSLTTFLLPPNWTSRPSNPYAVLFNGFYDIHDTGFRFYGASFMGIMADLQSQGYGSSVGILWNGGGAEATRTTHRSAYDNAALLFSKAAGLLGINPQKVVMVGGSRGGITALEMAANPYHDNYSVKYAFAYAPAVKYGEHLADFHNPSYPAMFGVSGGSETGYKYAWRQGWKDPTGLSGNELAMYNLLGTTNRQAADGLSPWSDRQVAALKNKGTKVLLSAPSHDVFMPYSLFLKYVDKLRVAGVPLRFEIGYRFGHNDPTDWKEHTKIALRRTLIGDTAFETGTYHYKRKSESEWQISVPFTPSHQPVFAELPKMAAWGETVSMTIAGGAGTMYDMSVWKINDDLWINQKRVEKIGRAVYAMKGAFPASGPAVQSKVDLVPISSALVTGYYIYELSYSIDGGATWVQIPPEAVPQPYADKQPTLQIVSEEPMVSGHEISHQIGQNGRAWGLSSDILFEISETRQGFTPSPTLDTPR